MSASTPGGARRPTPEHLPEGGAACLWIVAAAEERAESPLTAEELFEAGRAARGIVPRSDPGRLRAAAGPRPARHPAGAAREPPAEPDRPPGRADERERRSRSTAARPRSRPPTSPRVPTTGAEVVICGDAHLSNFGIYRSPENSMVFDINDFDESTVGPWEWDVKRLLASVVLAGRSPRTARRPHPHHHRGGRRAIPHRAAQRPGSAADDPLLLARLGADPAQPQRLEQRHGASGRPGHQGVAQAYERARRPQDRRDGRERGAPLRGQPAHPEACRAGGAGPRPGRLRAVPQDPSAEHCAPRVPAASWTTSRAGSSGSAASAPGASSSRCAGRPARWSCCS